MAEEHVEEVFLLVKLFLIFWLLWRSTHGTRTICHKEASTTYVIYFRAIDACPTSTRPNSSRIHELQGKQKVSNSQSTEARLWRFFPTPSSRRVAWWHPAEGLSLRVKIPEKKRFDRIIG